MYIDTHTRFTGWRSENHPTPPSAITGNRPFCFKNVRFTFTRTGFGPPVHLHHRSTWFTFNPRPFRSGVWIPRKFGAPKPTGITCAYIQLVCPADQSRPTPTCMPYFRSQRQRPRGSSYVFVVFRIFHSRHRRGDRKHSSWYASSPRFRKVCWQLVVVNRVRFDFRSFDMQRADSKPFLRYLYLNHNNAHIGIRY